MNDTLVLRVAEIFLKGGNRKAFFQQFVRNARRLLKDLDGVSVESMYLRVLVWHPPALRQQCIDRLLHLFGLSSMSPAVTCERGLDAFGEAALGLARSYPAGTSFKVKTRRRDKSFRLTSPEVSIEIGGRIVQDTGLAVDLHNPDRTIQIEIGPTRCFVYGEVIPGPGGLPVGSSGNVSLLLSGGIDSPVAAWSMMRRGCHVNAIYFHSFPYTGDKTKEKVLTLARHLLRWQHSVTVNVVHFTEVQKTLRDHGRADLAVLLYRRMMVRAAALIARAEHAHALATGENLGQVASQTIQNIGVIEDASPLPILRPLIAYDKREIVDRAKLIGTFDTSILPYDDCCSLFVPKHPATKARVSDLERAERGLDVAEMARSLAEGSERLVLRRGAQE